LKGKRYFGGGTVEMNLVRSQRHEFKKTPEDWLEDGTAAFLDIIAVNHGFDAIERAPGGILGIKEHTHGIARCRIIKNLYHQVLHCIISSGTFMRLLWI
jgi:hypothetical protein